MYRQHGEPFYTGASKPTIMYVQITWESWWSSEAASEGQVWALRCCSPVALLGMQIPLLCRWRIDKQASSLWPYSTFSWRQCFLNYQLIESSLFASSIWTPHPENLNISAQQRACCSATSRRAGSSQRAGIVSRSSLCPLPNPLWPW